MVGTQLSVVGSGQKEEILAQDVSNVVDRLDFLDIQILRKFYMTGKAYPYDTQPYCFPLLYKQMKTSRQLSVGMEALRKRLCSMTKLGLLEKIKNSNPTGYAPFYEKKATVQALITKFFLVNGLTQFL